MEDIILHILDELRRGRAVDDRALVRIVNTRAKRDGAEKRAYAKRRLLPFYQRVRAEEPERWASWGVTPELERQLVAALRMKPRRSASGVATITVITKPWPCGSDCLYCPNDVRMPKSYPHDEPACARAEQNRFDPYLQVSARLTALAQMGHATDKIELIVLGGTWSDYPRAYQVWFVSELFRALNDGAGLRGVREPAPVRRARLGAGPHGCRHGPARGRCAPSGALRGVRHLRGRRRARAHRRARAGRRGRRRAQLQPCPRPPVRRVERMARGVRLAGGRPGRARKRLQRENERARHRVVGLVIETRPDAIDPSSLELIRRLGCTKVQMGVQSTDQRILDANGRGIDTARIARAFDLLRIFGFKIHAHAMANLVGATPEADRRDYLRLVTDRAYQPDEVKLYPCALIASARLDAYFERGEWRPYTEDELLEVLVDDVLATPAFCRISRMVRDFSSDDIKAGNKKPNLRQLVERRAAACGRPVCEIRYREIGSADADPAELSLDEVAYETGNTRERFLQWVTPTGKIAGFLRLSLPDPAYVERHAAELPVAADEAMIREVHVYGTAARLHEADGSAQHLGLGRALVERACEIARAEGYRKINVISAVGTRGYYRALGFHDNGLYQRRDLS